MIKKHDPDIRSGLKKRRITYFVCLCFLCLLLLLLITLNMTQGQKTYSLAEVFRSLFSPEESTSIYIVNKLRFPRTMAAIFCGMAFGIAGNTFQTLLGNPLASPDIVGVSSGSAVAAVFCLLVLHTNRGMVSLMAVLFGLATATLLYLLSYQNGYSTTRLILTGIGTQAFFSALINWMVMKAAEYDVPTAMRWMTGNLNELSPDALPWLYILVPICILCIGFMTNHMKALELGDTYATILGLSVKKVRILLIGLAVLLLAIATSVSGPIAAVSFLAGPIASRLCGKNYSNTLSSGLTGAILVLLADFVGQNLTPTRYPVGIITGLLGAPYLIYLLIRFGKGAK
ncbi:MAG: iron ABC transporter permease [Lachnospiraceae bacterium]|nr:iron ABC transporter permease [Lachnospiraceae bacterium]